MKKVHRYELFVMAKGRWHSFRAVCWPEGMELWGHSNYEVDEDFIDDWIDWVMGDYEERTGLQISLEIYNE